MGTAPDDMTPDEYQVALRIARLSEHSPNYRYFTDNALLMAKEQKWYKLRDERVT